VRRVATTWPRQVMEHGRIPRVPTPTRQLCAVLHDGHVLTDGSRRVPAYESPHRHTPLLDRATTSGDPTAVPAAPQLQVHPEPSVLLSVLTPRAGRVPGVWTPVLDLAEDEAVVKELLSVDAVVTGRAEPPPRRPAWFQTSWYDEVEAWVDEQLSASGRLRTGPVRPVKVWSMSAVLEVPVDGSGRVWLKAACRHFHAEPALTRHVSEILPAHAPTVIATDDNRGWVLTEDMAGADENAVPAGIGPPAARIAATLQVRSLDHLPEIRAAGVPLRDLARTRQGFDAILDGSVELGQLTPEEVAAARATRAAVHALLAELEGLGVPDTLVHGDLHTGNVALDGDSLLLYDWSDASVSHPFLDAVLLSSRLSDAEQEAALGAYAEVWQAAYPAIDVARALELAVPVNTIFQMVTFEQIYQAQEEASYWEMSGVVARWLRGLPVLVDR
jgi:aminoglycoside phosphotransferase (APT) family kinase protein